MSTSELKHVKRILVVVDGASYMKRVGVGGEELWNSWSHYEEEIEEATGGKVAHITFIDRIPAEHVMALLKHSDANSSVVHSEISLRRTARTFYDVMKARLGVNKCSIKLLHCKQNSYPKNTEQAFLQAGLFQAKINREIYSTSMSYVLQKTRRSNGNRLKGSHVVVFAPPMPDLVELDPLLDKKIKLWRASFSDDIDPDSFPDVNPGRLIDLGTSPASSNPGQFAEIAVCSSQIPDFIKTFRNSELSSRGAHGDLVMFQRKLRNCSQNAMQKIINTDTGIDSFLTLPSEDNQKSESEQEDESLSQESESPMIIIK